MISVFAKPDYIYEEVPDAGTYEKKSASNNDRRAGPERRGR